MTATEFLRLATVRLNERANELAVANGTSRDRTLDELRYQAGTVAGLLLALAEITDVYRHAADEDDQEI
jgi:hypothetical protein